MSNPIAVSDADSSQTRHALRVEELYDRANGLENADLLDEAEAICVDINRHWPDFAYAWRTLGKIYIKRGDRRTALGHFRKALSLAPDNPWIAFDLGDVLCGLALFDEADAAFRALTGQHPDFMHGWRGLAMVASRRGDREAATGHFRAALNLAPDDSAIALELGDGLRELGRLIEAEATFHALTQRRPDFSYADLSKAWRGLGMVARQRGDRTKAIGHFRKALSLAPDDPWIAYDLGDGLRELGLFDEAGAAFRALTGQRPDFVHGWRGLGMVARQRGDREAAIGHFRAALELVPDDPSIASELGHELLDLGRIDEAEATFRALTQRRPDLSTAWRGLGMVARQRGDRTEAVRHFRKALSLAPDDPWIAYDLGDGLRELGVLDEAVATFRALTEQRPDFVHAWRGLAIATGRSGDTEAAIAHFRTALERAPDDRSIALELGHELREWGRFDEAEATFRALTERRSDSRADLSKAWRGLAMVARQRGDRLAAMDHFRKAQSLDPDDPWIAVDLGHELRQLDRFDEADAAFRALTGQRPDFVHAWRGLAIVSGQRGDPQAAIGHFRTALAIAPDDPSIAVELGHELRASGRFDEAEAMFRALTERRSDSHAILSHAWRGLAMVARQRGDRTRAIDHFRTALSLAPDDPWIAVDLAHELRDAGAGDEAEAAFQALVAQHSSFAHGWRGLGFVRRERGRHREALEFFRRASTLEPDSVGHKLDIACTLRESGRIAEAAAMAKKVADEHPKSAMALIVLAEALFGAVPHDQIIHIHQKAVALEPGSIQAQNLLGGAYLKRGLLDEAEEIFDRVLQASPNDLSALLGGANVARRRGDRDAALDLLRKAFAVNRSNESVAQELAFELNAMGRRDEAREALRIAMSEQIYSPSCENYLGHIARMKGEFATARAHFANVVERAPHFASAQIELAEEEFRLGQIETSIGRLKRLHRSMPGYAPALERLADFSTRLDDLHGALAFRRRAVALDPSNFRHHLEIARIHAALGERPAAEATIRKAQAFFGPIPEITLMYGEILHQSGDYDAARALLAEAFENWPADFEIWIKTAWMLGEAGEFRAARELLDAPRGPLNRHERGRVEALNGQISAAQWRPEEALDWFMAAVDDDPASEWIYEWVARMALMRADAATARHYLHLSKKHDCVHLIRHGGMVKTSQSHVGQLLDEFRLDKEALSALRLALAESSPASTIARLLLDRPDYTPAAINYLIALRRQGLLESRAPDVGAARRIPRLILQYWDENIPDDVAALCETWRENNAGFAYRRYSLADARPYLEAMSSKALHAFDRAQEPAMKADIFRLAVLLLEGGYYADADDRCRSTIEALAPAEAELLLYQEDYGTVGNNFIGVVPGHPAIREAFDQAVDAISRGDADIVWLSTGPGLLTRCVARYLAESPGLRLKTTRILERHELRRAVAMHCPASYKHTARHWSRSSFRHSANFRRGVEALAEIIASDD